MHGADHLRVVPVRSAGLQIARQARKAAGRHMQPQSMPAFKAMRNLARRYLHCNDLPRLAAGAGWRQADALRAFLHVDRVACGIDIRQAHHNIKIGGLR